MQSLFHAQQLQGFLLFELEQGDAGHLGDHVRDVILGDHRPVLLLALLPFPLGIFQELAQTLFLLAELDGFLKVLEGDRQLLLAGDLLEFLFHGAQIAGQGIGLQLGARPRLIDHVDGLVGKEPIRDVPIRELDGLVDGLLRDFNTVVALIPVAQPLDDADGLLHAGLLHINGLEAPFQRPVLFNVLAILIQGGRADALDLAPRERGLEHVGGVDGPLRRAGPDQRMELINEDDHVARLNDLLHDHLETLFELAAILGAGHKRPQVQRDDAPVEQIVGNLRAHDALGEPFDDRRLADTGFPDQHRVVLGPPAEDLQHPLDLVLAADDRIQRAFLRQVGQVAPEFIQGRGVALAIALPRGTFTQKRHRQLAGGQKIGAQAPENFPADALLFPQEAE